MRSNTAMFSGILGGGIVVAIFMIAMFAISLFNYRISFDKIQINNTGTLDTMWTSNDSIITKEESVKKALMQQLSKEKIILTPQEYTTNIVNYYNTLLAILSVMLAAFSAVSFVYLKSQSKDLIQETLQSDEFQENVSEKLLGRVESNFREDISNLREKIKELENKLIENIKEDNSDKDETQIE